MRDSGLLLGEQRGQDHARWACPGIQRVCRIQWSGFKATSNLSNRSLVWRFPSFMSNRKSSNVFSHRAICLSRSSRRTYWSRTSLILACSFSSPSATMRVICLSLAMAAPINAATPNISPDMTPMSAVNSSPRPFLHQTERTPRFFQRRHAQEKDNVRPVFLINREQRFRGHWLFDD